VQHQLEYVRELSLQAILNKWRTNIRDKCPSILTVRGTMLRCFHVLPLSLQCDRMLVVVSDISDDGFSSIPVTISILHSVSWDLGSFPILMALAYIFISLSNRLSWIDKHQILFERQRGKTDNNVIWTEEKSLYSFPPVPLVTSRCINSKEGTTRCIDLESEDKDSTEMFSKYLRETIILRTLPKYLREGNSVSAWTTYLLGSIGLLWNVRTDTAVTSCFLLLM
jgi:hypothetical protein